MLDVGSYRDLSSSEGQKAGLVRLAAIYHDGCKYLMLHTGLQP